MSLVEIQDDGLVVINDPLVSVSGLLEEARLHSKQEQANKKRFNNSSTNSNSGMYLQRLWIENDEIAQEIEQRPWKSLEIVSCQGSKLPWLVGTALKQQSLKKFALRKIASRLESCIGAIRVSGLSHVQELTLEMAFSERSGQSLASALDTMTSTRCCSLVDLKLERCSFIIPSALSAFAEGLKYNTSLKSLSLIKCKLRDDDFQALFPCLPSTLENLDLTGNYCRHQFRGLLHSEVQCINLTNQHPGEFGASLEFSQIGSDLSSNKTLRSLDLSFNMLTIADIEGLVDALALAGSHSCIESLNLMSNHLDDNAIQYMGSKLPEMLSLRRLDISSNRFGDEGAVALLRGLRHNVTLCHLEMPRGFEKEDEIRHLLALNWGGRRLLQQRPGREGRKKLSRNSIKQPKVPLGLWPSVFERVNSLSVDNNGISHVNMRVSVMLFLLQEGPIWIGREH
ncbi:leucine rich repeat LRR-containing protein [Nitzschia inconspicua]|uniref:Leucine rich repeat LRR-containing protein n=1 Tax=Nitzschia inconspicua TaxID=303405 RepID=A0A9K3PML8_9STRA|nr:leucine rich repeat LRR-containing protein [Nitzschia inconspicua]